MTRALFRRQRSVADETADTQAAIKSIQTALVQQREQKELSSTENALDILQRAVNNLGAEILPARITWEPFLEKLLESVDFAKHQRNQEMTLKAVGLEDGRPSTHHLREAPLGMSAKVFRLSSRVDELMKQFKGTLLDATYESPTPSPKKSYSSPAAPPLGRRKSTSMTMLQRSASKALLALHASSSKSRDLDMGGMAMLPSSGVRRKRRMMYFLAMFEEVAKRNEIVYVHTTAQSPYHTTSSSSCSFRSPSPRDTLSRMYTSINIFVCCLQGRV